ncbi:MAG: hypothetical protein IJ381_05240 [Clostridia bacterium]|nr:hypothetical protein [Clostridia bacterium]
MKKRFWLRFIESCAFLVLLSAVLVFVSGLVERKKGPHLFGAFFEEPKAYDVLFLGDSRFMNGMMPLDLWSDYGIAGYNLSCYGNSLPATYWMMMNALDYAHPKLVVLSVNGVGDERKITGSSGDLHTAFDSFPLTRTKVRAIEDLMHDPERPDAVDDEGNRYQNIKWEYYFTLGKYHSRWSELTREDFARHPAHQRGGEELVGVLPYGEYEIIEDDLYAEEMGHGYSYLRKAIEECQSRGIDILLVNMPDPAMHISQKHAHTAGSIAEEYGIDYIDLMQMDCVIDYEVDCYDEQPHLNVSGTQKVTDYLGSYLHNRYDLPDRRDDPRYLGWKAARDAYVDQKIERIRAQQSMNNVLMLLHDDDFDIRMGIYPDSPLHYDDTSILLMHNLAREHVLAGEEYEKWSNAMYPLEGFDAALWDNQPYYMHRKSGAVHEYTGEEALSAMASAFGKRQSAEVMIEIIDRRNGKTAAQLCF